MDARKSFIGEFIGTFIMVLIGCASVAGAVLFQWYSSLVIVAAIWGIGVGLGILAARLWSDAHLNPAVTIASWLADEFDVKQLFTYWSGQLTGAFTAGLTLYALVAERIVVFEQVNGIVRGAYGSHVSAQMFGEFYPNPGYADQLDVSTALAMAIECCGTFLLLLGIHLVTRTIKANRATAPWLIGLVVSLIILLIAPYTQAGINPARDLAPRMVTILFGWGNAVLPTDGGAFWVYVLGPLSGASIFVMAKRLLSNAKSNPFAELEA